MSLVAFIGLGQMGCPMSLNVLRGGHQLRIFDLNAATMDALAEAGATACATPAEAAIGAEYVITMLPNGELVREVLLGKDGVIESLTTDALVIDMSTIHPMQTDQLIVDMASRGFEMLDVPVGRTSDQAVTGSLLLLAGGTPAQIERARPLLMLMGNELVEAGGPGKGIETAQGQWAENGPAAHGNAPGHAGAGKSRGIAGHDGRHLCWMTHGPTHADGSAPVVQDQGAAVDAQALQQGFQIVYVHVQAVAGLLRLVGKTAAQMIRHYAAVATLQLPHYLAV